jgi:pimeloyl-ACP methyl ester carboxylesterase
MAAEPQPFRIAVADDVLHDLRARIRATRWPDPPTTGAGFAQGLDPALLRPLLDYWADAFDWRAYEAWLNSFPHFRAGIDSLGVHFIHVRSAQADAVPLVLTHGWPSTFVEMLPLVPLLSGPGDLPGGPYHLVIPSLPGFGFSDRPHRPGTSTRVIAGMWVALMASLGYERFGAHGTDFGASVAAFLGLDHPNAVLGLHLTNLDEHPRLGPMSPPLTAAEAAYRAAFEQWLAAEHAYADIQATKPETLGYGLTDSPAALAAWILEKWGAWSDSDGDPTARFDRDMLCGLLTIYWATGTATSSLRIYWEQRRMADPITPQDRIRVPTAIARFDHHFAHEGAVPREWVERLYDVQRWTEMPRGGHFAATEEPELVAHDLAAFFASLRS